jgi:predicted nuclease of predicted toxin-antitoxin system
LNLIFLIDAQLPRSLAEYFRSKGYQAYHVRDLMIAQASDEEIFLRAKELSAIVVSKDSDFASIKSRLAGPQVLWLRVGNLKKSALTKKLDSIWEDVVDELTAGGSIIEVR